MFWIKKFKYKSTTTHEEQNKTKGKKQADSHGLKSFYQMVKFDLKLEADLMRGRSRVLEPGQ